MNQEQPIQGLPENAYRELKPGETYPEATFWSIA